MSETRADCNRCGLSLPFSAVENREWWKCGKCGERNYTKLHLKNSHSNLKNELANFKLALLSDEAVEAVVEIDYNYEKMERRQTRKDKAELMLKAAIKCAEDTEKKEEGR